MKLQTILNHAKSGELKNVKSSHTDDTITHYVNLALIALYSRFPLKTGEAIISLRDGKTIYNLDGSDPDGDVTINGVVPTDDNILTIYRVYDERREIPLNYEGNPLSVFTTGYNALQVPITMTGAYLSVIYLAGPDEIVYDDSTPEAKAASLEQNVPIPKQMLEAMLHYIGYRAHGSVDGNVQAENNTHLMRYEASCRRILELGLFPQDSLFIPNSVKGFLV